MNVLVAVDLSEASRRVLQSAQRLCTDPVTSFWIVHVSDPEPDFMGYDAGPQSQRDAVAAQTRQAHRDLQALAEAWRADGRDCNALLVQGVYAEKILSEADRLQCDLIVVGSHGKGMARQLLLGSTSERVLRDSPVPVLVVPTHDPS